MQLLNYCYSILIAHAFLAEGWFRPAGAQSTNWRATVARSIPKEAPQMPNPTTWLDECWFAYYFETSKSFVVKRTQNAASYSIIIPAHKISSIFDKPAWEREGRRVVRETSFPLYGNCYAFTRQVASIIRFAYANHVVWKDPLHFPMLILQCLRGYHQRPAYQDDFKGVGEWAGQSQWCMRYRCGHDQHARCVRTKINERLWAWLRAHAHVHVRILKISAKSRHVVVYSECYKVQQQASHPMRWRWGAKVPLSAFESMCVWLSQAQELEHKYGS